MSLSIAVDAGPLRRRRARSYGLDLATLNRKHFPMIAGLVVPY